ncbi:unnamed protein product, partial [Ilex paraguariensis]
MGVPREVADSLGDMPNVEDDHGDVVGVTGGVDSAPRAADGGRSSADTMGGDVVHARQGGKALGASYALGVGTRGTRETLNDLALGAHSEKGVKKGTTPDLERGKGIANNDGSK